MSTNLLYDAVSAKNSVAIAVVAESDAVKVGTEGLDPKFYYNFALVPSHALVDPAGKMRPDQLETEKEKVVAWLPSTMERLDCWISN